MTLINQRICDQNESNGMPNIILSSQGIYSKMSDLIYAGNG